MKVVEAIDLLVGVGMTQAVDLKMQLEKRIDLDVVSRRKIKKFSNRLEVAAKIMHKYRLDTFGKGEVNVTDNKV